MPSSINIGPNPDFMIKAGLRPLQIHSSIDPKRKGLSLPLLKWNRYQQRSSYNSVKNWRGWVLESQGITRHHRRVNLCGAFLAKIGVLLRRLSLVQPRMNEDTIVSRRQSKSYYLSFLKEVCLIVISSVSS
jgi:hypothetical protein